MAVRVHDRIAEVPEAAWDGLLAADATASPFVRWAWLEALEHGSCAGPATGWRPRHLTLWRDDRLVAAAPAYARDHSDGDFARDWGWADFAARAGVRYYPKLLVGVPFTPVTGRRILAAPGEDRRACVAALVNAALGVAERERMSSLQVLFADAVEIAELEASGLARRMDFQCHWVNLGYRAPDDWLADLDAKRRRQARRERAAPAAQGITIRTVRGDELARDPEGWARAVHGFYRATLDRLAWGRPWLDEAFFLRVFARMPDCLEVVEATRAGRRVAGALNAASATRLYGRTWGCVEQHDLLHFNVCLYHSIDDCIARGLQVFEGGAGGEHKLFRGFDLAPTWSAHAFLDPRMDRAIREYLVLDTRRRSGELAAWRAKQKKYRGRTGAERGTEHGREA